MSSILNPNPDASFDSLLPSMACFSLCTQALLAYLEVEVARLMSTPSHDISSTPGARGHHPHQQHHHNPFGGPARRLGGLFAKVSEMFTGGPGEEAGRGGR